MADRRGRIMVVTVAALVVALLAAVATRITGQRDIVPVIDANVPRMPGELRVVTFGTSLTAGGGWQGPLERALAGCIDRPVRVLRVAKAGALSTWGLDHVEEVIYRDPDIVLVEYYANDAAVQRLVSVAKSRATMRDMLGALRARLPQARIILMGMNPFAGRGIATRPRLEAYIQAHREEAAALGLEYIDHRPAWLKLSAEARAAAIPDGTHPLPDMAANIMVPPLADSIAGRPCPER